MTALIKQLRLCPVTAMPVRGEGTDQRQWRGSRHQPALRNRVLGTHRTPIQRVG